ncbi:MAG TPA: MBL fold metallo-hydrolase [Candidatus Saccharimonadales bacterium]|nr:MBL fold metallo-hydrolase [Candidatus Saccharimonadales bacterium]
MIFRQILHEEKSCLSYMVGCPDKGVCAVVDAQGKPEEYINLADKLGLKITAVIETHIQADHLSSSAELARKARALLYFGPKATIKYDFKELSDGATIKIGRRTIKAIHTPGHTAEHISLLVDDWLVMTGDTLFVGDVGRVDLVEEDAETAQVKAKAKDLYQSVQKLLKLPDWTEIYPGHYRGSACGKGMDSKTSSTIGRERRKNPALQLDERAFIKYLFEDMPVAPRDFIKIKRKNSGYH